MSELKYHCGCCNKHYEVESGATDQTCPDCGLQGSMRVRLWVATIQKYVSGYMYGVNENSLTAHMKGDDGVNYWSWPWSAFDPIPA